MEANDKNSNNWKDGLKNLIFVRITVEFKCLTGEDKNSNFWKDRIRILTFEGWDKNSKVSKNKMRIPLFSRIR